MLSIYPVKFICYLRLYWQEVLLCIKFLENKSYDIYKNTWEITFLPCINPYGYEFGTRENHQRKDLNRLFKIEKPPLEVLFAQSILDSKFDLTLELHEDNESSGYYLYQKSIENKQEGIGLNILNSLKGRNSIIISPGFIAKEFFGQYNPEFRATGRTS